MLTALLCLSLVFPLTTPNNSRVGYTKELLKKSDFSKTQIDKIFSDKRLALIKIPKGQLLDWKKFTKEILEPKSVAKGLEYLKANAEIFKSAESVYHIPKESLAAILRIETNFGDYLGEYPAINALYTMLVVSKTENRWKFAAENLAAFIRYCRKHGLDYFSMKGSSAGAIGLVQFMPATLENLGVDADGDGQIDLFKPHDAIPSAANFLAKNGWGKTQYEQVKVLARYYGSSVGYPNAAILYANALAKLTASLSSSPNSR